MKRIILSLLVTACLTACSKNDNDAPDDKKPPVTLEPKPAPEPTVGVYYYPSFKTNEIGC